MVDLHVPGIVDDTHQGVPTVNAIAVSEFEQLLYHDDLENVFFNTDEFAITISYYHSSLNKWTSYAVIFDDPYAAVTLNQIDFTSIRPQFQVAESKLLHPILKNDRCKIKGVEYRIEDYSQDGVGVTTVYLRTK